MRPIKAEHVIALGGEHSHTIRPADHVALFLSAKNTHPWVKEAIEKARKHI